MAFAGHDDVERDLDDDGGLDRDLAALEAVRSDDARGIVYR
jgi:hypothetical protein